LAVIELIDHPQLQSLSLGVGQKVQSVRQIGCLGARVDLSFQMREFFLVMVKLDAEATAHLKLRTAATVKPAHEVARDTEEPGHGLLVTASAKPIEADERLGERLCRQVRGGRQARRLRSQPALDPDRVTSVELAERLGISPRRQEQISIALVLSVAAHHKQVPSEQKM
jgi:hypothetical protein